MLSIFLRPDIFLRRSRPFVYISLKLFYLNLSIAALKHSPSKKGKRDSIKKRTTSEKDGNEPISPVTATNQTNGQGKKRRFWWQATKWKKWTFFSLFHFSCVEEVESEKLPWWQFVMFCLIWQYLVGDVLRACTV